jgi:hypothetical protein
MTSDPNGRLRQHQTRFGKLVDMEILQEEFVDETPEEAERKWIIKFSDFPLLNIMKKLPPRKRLDIKQIEDKLECSMNILEHLEQMRNAELARLDRIASLRRSYIARLKERTANSPNPKHPPF